MFPFVLGKGTEASRKNLTTWFERDLDAQKDGTSWEGRGGKNHSKHLYFDQLLFLLPHLEDREKQSNLSTQRNEDEDEANNSKEEEKEPHRNIRKKKLTTISYEELLQQILRQKKKWTIQV